MKNKTLNSIIFITITIGLLIFLNFYMLPLTNNLFDSYDGGSVAVANYNTLIIKYLLYIVIFIIIQIFNIIVFSKKSNLLYSVKYPLNSICFLNIIIVLCFYILSPMFIWIIALFGAIPILIIFIISLVIGIVKDTKNNKHKDLL